MTNKVRIITLLAITLATTACSSVKEYEKQQVNDPDMALTAKSSEKYETNFQIYREGASGANSGKTGGGCGCN